MRLWRCDASKRGLTDWGFEMDWNGKTQIRNDSDICHLHPFAWSSCKYLGHPASCQASCRLQQEIRVFSVMASWSLGTGQFLRRLKNVKKKTPQTKQEAKTDIVQARYKNGPPAACKDAAGKSSRKLHKKGWHDESVFEDHLKHLRQSLICTLDMQCPLFPPQKLILEPRRKSKHTMLRETDHCGSLILLLGSLW